MAPYLHRLRRLTRHYRGIDYLTQGYTLLVGVLILLFHDASVPQWHLLVGGHIGALVAVHALIRLDEHRSGRITRVLRDFYPILLYTFFYLETHHLKYMFVEQRLDALVIHLEQWLFGCQPSRCLVERFDSLLVSELFFLSYFTYYVMIFGVALWLYPTDRRDFLKYVTTVSAVFYVCYLIYIFLPVLGPYAPAVVSSTEGYEALIGPRWLAPAVEKGPFFRIMGLIYRYAEVSGGAALPSSHVAVAIVTLGFTWPRLKRLRWVHAVFVVLLSISTIYCGYHYAVDALAGAAAAVLLAPLGVLLYEKTRHLGTPIEQREEAG